MNVLGTKKMGILKPDIRMSRLQIESRWAFLLNFLPHHNAVCPLKGPQRSKDAPTQSNNMTWIDATSSQIGQASFNLSAFLHLSLTHPSGNGCFL